MCYQQLANRDNATTLPPNQGRLCSERRKRVGSTGQYGSSPPDPGSPRFVHSSTTNSLDTIQMRGITYGPTIRSTTVTTTSPPS